jgi:large subunit ribosomal protein L10
VSAVQKSLKKGESTLPITKERRAELVAEYIDTLQKCQGLVISEYRGLTMPKFNKVRLKLREANAEYVVAKNTLLKIALNEVGMAVPEQLLVGPVAVGFAFGDLSSTVKALLDVSKDEELLLLKGAIAQTNIYQQNQLKMLSELPTMDQLRASLIGMITQPAATLISLLVTPQRDVVSVIAAYVDKNGGESAA